MNIVNFFFCLIVSLITLNCGSDADNYYLENFSDLTGIEVTLMWDASYDSSSIEVNVLPPDSQPHYKHTLTMNHSSETVTDVLVSFTGMDSSSKTTSTVTRDSTVYNQLKTYLERATYVVKNPVSSDECSSWSGASVATIDFETGKTTDKTVYFYDTTCPAEDNSYKLSSEAFSDYLESLRTDRN